MSGTSLETAAGALAGSVGAARAMEGLAMADRDGTIEAFGVDCRVVDPWTLVRTEWLLTDGLGGFAMGTALGAAARRYHGLLVTATHPPVGRVVAWNGVVERLTLDPGGPHERTVELSTHRFPGGMLHPDGFGRLARFEKRAASAVWTWRFDGVEVSRELTLAAPGADEHGRAVLEYTVRSPHAARLSVAPLVSLGHFHTLLREGDGWSIATEPRGERGVRIVREGVRLTIEASAGRFEPQADWWRRFELDRERERGQDFLEDLFSPGRFVIDFAGSPEGERAALKAVAAPAGAAEGGAWDGHDEAARARSVRSRAAARAHEHIVREAPGLRFSRECAALVNASMDFIVARSVDGRPARTVIAGYPWFSDWGRDTLIALPGLMLTTGRMDDARGALETFARHVRRGLVPNVFDDATGEPHYNTVDASLWFLHAATEYARLSGDEEGFRELLRPACLDIVEHYTAGTDFGIGMDPADGLIRAGDDATQLTWMDAKHGDTVFTPRHGKPVEINALWRHGLLALARALPKEDKALAASLRKRAEQAGASIRKLFWNDEGGWAYDCLVPGPSEGEWIPTTEFRPNQIFLVSLEDSPLTAKRQKRLVEAVRERLLTPMGMRTLEEADPRFCGRYEGDMRSRDAAYHNGTVWPWLLGPFLEAHLRVHGHSADAREEVKAFAAPLLKAMAGPLAGGACLGQVAEVYDGSWTADQPQRAGGCPGQAWSVAEMLRLVAIAG